MQARRAADVCRVTVRRKLAACVALLLLLSTASAARALLDRQRAGEALAGLREVQRQQQRLTSVDRSVELRWREIRVLMELAPSPGQLQVLHDRIDDLEAEAQALADVPAAAAFAEPCAALVASWRGVVSALEARQAIPVPLDPQVALATLDEAVQRAEVQAVQASDGFIVAQRQADFSTLSILAVSFASGVLVVTFLSFTVTRGLSVLDEASRHMGSGDLAYRIRSATNDEFARVGRTFNDMAARLATALDEARDARAQAESALAVKSAFVRAMSHDLRTPLTVVLGYVDVIDDDVRAAGLSSTANDVAALRRGVLVLNGMVGELLDLARLEANRMPVTLEIVDLAELVEDVVQGVRPLVEQRGNRVTTDVAVPVMVTDGTKLRHILQNLIGNACKFTEAGDITVRTRHATSADGAIGVRVTVSDTGIGMSPEELRRVFEPFQQANASVQQRFGGTGLGLAITRGYVDLLEGTVAVDSATGQGTTFTVWLPDGARRAAAVA